MGGKSTTTNAEIPNELKPLFTGHNSNLTGLEGPGATGILSMMQDYYYGNLRDLITSRLGEGADGTWRPRPGDGYDIPPGARPRLPGPGDSWGDNIVDGFSTTAQGNEAIPHGPSQKIDPMRAYQSMISGGPQWDTSKAEGQASGLFDARMFLDQFPDWAAGLDPNQQYAGDALRSSLGQYYNINQDGSIGSEKAIDENNPLFQNARSVFDKTTKQAIGNSAALSGLGNSNAKVNALASGWGEQFTPIYSMLANNQQAGRQFATSGLMDYGKTAQANTQKMLDNVNAEKNRQRTMAENLSTGLIGGIVPSTIGSKTTGGGLFK